MSRFGQAELVKRKSSKPRKFRIFGVFIVQTFTCKMQQNGVAFFAYTIREFFYKVKSPFIKTLFKGKQSDIMRGNRRPGIQGVRRLKNVKEVFV